MSSRIPKEDMVMSYEARFCSHLGQLHKEGRYRVFADIKRRKGAYPLARNFHPGG